MGAHRGGTESTKADVCLGIGHIAVSNKSRVVLQGEGGREEMGWAAKSASHKFT